MACALIWRGHKPKKNPQANLRVFSFENKFLQMKKGGSKLPPFSKIQMDYLFAAATDKATTNSSGT
ncbi:MAG: hypothetical protein ACK4SS_00880, partial [Cypionkella sp.]